MGSAPLTGPGPKWDGWPEPLAIIGLSFRFPGGAETTQTFWNMLLSKTSASSLTPRDRFNVDAHYNTNASRIGSLSYRGGNFLAGDAIDSFDPIFFSIGAAEAHAMDPVHRLALETAYHALENAGLSLDQVAGTKTAVFAGSTSTDYVTIMNKDPEQMAKYHATGASSNMMANRLSWAFNLTGPSASVDAACNSSLTALDLVCRSIWSGSATMGLACGGNIILTPESGMWLDNIGVLSKDSQCFTLDERANGYARGEGCGVLVIKPVSAALRDGDTIRAIIRATNSNSNGNTTGLTQPSRDAQYNLIRDTYAWANLDLATTRYVEAHGTGTPLGDPLEFEAIGHAFRPYRSPKEPLYVGSVKTNIGHQEGGSGIAGVIKAILMLEAGVIVPNAKFVSMNPKIDAELLRIAVVKDAIPWPSQGLRRISVQCFGFGGANTHVVLDDARGFLRAHGLQGNHNTVAVEHEQAGPDTQIDLDTMVATRSHERLFVWSTDDKGGIERTKKAWDEYFNSMTFSSQTVGEKDKYLADIAYTLASRRTHLGWRAFAVAGHLNHLADLSKQISAPIRASADQQLVFVFTGQGSQWFAMGRELIHRYDTFKSSLMSATTFFETLGCKWDVIDELSKNLADSKVDSPLFSQPLCTVIQVALVELLESFGIRPAAVVGHSSGEIAAALCKQAISRESAWKLAYWRGVVAAQLAETGSIKGGMMAVGLSASKIQRYLLMVERDLGASRLVVACINSPTNATISGDEEHLDHIQLLLQKRGDIFHRKLRVALAYHSFHMESVSSEYLKKIDSLEPGLSADGGKEGGVRMASSVTGSWISAFELGKPQYWVQNLVSPVLFSDALTTICGNLSQEPNSSTAIVEVGPHPALQGPSKEVLRSLGKENITHYIPLLIRNRSAVHTVLESAGHLHAHGCPVNFASLNSESTGIGKEYTLRSISTLPAYSFNHTKSYWHESRLSKDYRFRPFGWHDLLGVRDSDWNPLEARWRHIIRPSDQPWIEDHQVNGTMIFPAAGMFTMVIEAAKQMADPEKEVVGFTFKHATFHSVFKIPTGTAGIEASLHMKPQGQRGGKGAHNDWQDFRVYTFDSATKEWQQKCYGSVRVTYALEDSSHLHAGRELREWRKSQRQSYAKTLQRCTLNLDVSLIYDAFAALGYGYGPSFKAIKGARHDASDSAVSEVQTYRDTNQQQNHVVHPTTLDCIFQTMFLATVAGGMARFRLAVPSHVDHLWVSSKGLSYADAETIKVSTTSHRSGFREARASIIAMNKDEDTVLLQVKNLCVTDVASNQEATMAGDDNMALCHKMYWKPDLDLMSAEQIQSYCNTSRLVDENEASEPVDVFNEINFVVTAYIKRALSVLDSNTNQDLQPKSHISKYIEWMRYRMKLVAPTNSSLVQSEWIEHLDDTSLVNRTAEKITSWNASGRLYITIGSNLDRILSGELDPLRLLFDGDLVKEHYYRTWESIPAVRSFRQYLDALVHKNPKASILEVGAGTGATTVQLMKTLTTTGEGQEPCAPRFARYDYTDLSLAFFKGAELQFRELGQKMRFKKLDIESDPELQGFELGSYDIVVAALVLHATSNLKRTLEHCRKLLKPNGKLILWEGTVPNGLRTNFVFGLLEGWWLGWESYRKLTPCVTEDKWDYLLKQTGYTGIDLVWRDYENPICHEFSIVVSTAAPEHTPKPKNFEDEDIAVVHEHEQRHIAETLRLRLEAIHSTLRVRLLSLDNALESVGTPITGVRTTVVSLLELGRPVWLNITQKLFIKLQKLLTTADKTLWIGRNAEPAYSLVEGLSRVLNSELGNTKFTYLRLHARDQMQEGYAQHILQVCRQLLVSNGADTEYVEGDCGFLRIPRLMTPRSLNGEIQHRTATMRKVNRPWKDSRPLRLCIGSIGLLDTLHFVDDDQHNGMPLKPSEVQILVHSAGVNFKDVLVTLGSLNDQSVGNEIAGVVTCLGSIAASSSGLAVGDRVASIAAGSYRTSVRCNYRRVAKIPDVLDFSTAAAIPVNYVTAWYALHDIAHLEPGETVLIHSAAGGTGQAAIRVALHRGAKIFATVGTETKSQLLIREFGIPEDHIFSSRDTSFAAGIHRLTAGKGVDVVLNSLSGDSLIASWECVAPYGRFVEIGKKDIRENGNLPMGMFEKHVSFTAVDIVVLNQDRPDLVRKTLEHVLELTARQTFCPASPLQLYSVSALTNAFRSLQSGNSMGKIVIEFKPDDVVEAILEPKPTLSLDPDATYLIAGGLGGLGRSVAGWFVQQGARNLILLSRSGANSPEAKRIVGLLESQGAHIATPVCDISDESALRTVISDCLITMPAIKGCIQASMVLDEAPFESMTFNAWQAAVLPKVAGSYNLHTVLPKGLDFFIMFSSIAGVWGSRGLANYAAGNTFQDNLARYRVAQGERATSLDFGPFYEIGWMADKSSLRTLYKNITSGPVTPADLFALLDYFCDPTNTVTRMTSEYQAMVIRMAAQGQMAFYLDKPMLGSISLDAVPGENVDALMNPSATQSGGQIELAVAVSGASSPTAAIQAVTEALVQKTAATLMMEHHELDTSAPMHRYGVDSLVAVELRNWLAKTLQSEVALLDFMGSASIEGVSKLAILKSKHWKPEWT